MKTYNNSDGGAILIGSFVSFLLYIYTHSPLISIFSGLIIYALLARTRVLNKETQQKGQLKYITKKNGVKQIIYKYNGDPRTMTIPFFYHFYQLTMKHNIKQPNFWSHIDRIVSFWINIRDETKKEFPHQLSSQEERELLHSCWTQNANHQNIKDFLQMTEEYQWKKLPDHLKEMEQKDVHGAIEWLKIHKHVQDFFQKVGIQLMVGSEKVPCDCYQPPRFYGNNFQSFEQLESQHYLKNQFGS
jgi:hypothetical protein